MASTEKRAAYKIYGCLSHTVQQTKTLILVNYENRNDCQGSSYDLDHMLFWTNFSSLC